MSVIAWSSTSFDVRHMPPFLMREGNHGFIKGLCCCNARKSFRTGVFCSLGVLCKGSGKNNGCGDDVAAHLQRFQNQFWKFYDFLLFVRFVSISHPQSFIILILNETITVLHAHLAYLLKMSPVGTCSKSFVPQKIQLQSIGVQNLECLIVF